MSATVGSNGPSRLPLATVIGITVPIQSSPAGTVMTAETVVSRDAIASPTGRRSFAWESDVQSDRAAIIGTAGRKQDYRAELTHTGDR